MKKKLETSLVEQEQEQKSEQEQKFGEGRISKTDIAEKVDLFWACADCYCIEKHLANSIMQMPKKERKKYLEIYNKVREVRAKILAKILTNTKYDLWCLHPETIIMTNFSGNKIKEIINEKVLTHKGRFKESIVLIREWKGNIIKIYSYYSNFPLIITPNHKILVADNVRTKQKNIWRKNNNFNLVWKQAKDITENDFLLFPRIKKTIDKKYITIKYLRGRGKGKQLESFKLKITNDLMELTGLYISDGYTLEYNNYYKKENRNRIARTTTFTFNSNEKDIINKLQVLLQKCFNAKFYINKRRNIVEILTGNPFVHFFFKNFGKVSENKHLPDWVLYLPKHKLLYLLKGLVDGDGYISKYSIKYSTSSEKLAYQLRLILFKLGIIHSLCKYKVKDSVINGRKIIAKHPIFEITISGDSARELKKIFQNYDGGKKTSGNFGYVLNDYVMIPIKKIEKEYYDGEVYNLSVNEDETYTTINGVVHNCLGKHMTGAVMQITECAIKEKYEGNEEGALELFELAEIMWKLFWLIQKLGEK